METNEVNVVIDHTLLLNTVSYFVYTVSFVLHNKHVG